MGLNKEISDIFDAVSALTGAGVCLYDIRDYFYYDNVITKKNFAGHYCSFCKEIRKDPVGKCACEKSDVEGAVNLAKLYKKPFFNLCHIGLCEYVVPVMKNDILIAVAFLGQCRINNETFFENISDNIKKLGYNPDEFKVKFYEMPVIEKRLLMQGGKLLDMALGRLAEEKELSSFIREHDYSIAEKVMTFVKTSYMGSLTAGDVARAVHLNQSYLSRLFKKETGVTIGDYITGVRMENAKILLMKTKIPISSISFNVGYSDQNYFSRTFKKYTGKTPIEFRKENSRRYVQ